MKKKVKIFSASSDQNMEEEINKFLEENPEIEIEDRLMCYSHNHGSMPTIIISIFYKELCKEK